ncbi:hypothetical protein QTG54_004506 [Skeletonema marinoi]|uniref:Prokaryotic-type class I peptide chain release factors domain-containing protein n=1 Tax=Skeletonema marinoi TaxID=267567 RepID=A0AAD9DGQ7_9STRA|nr:hypothetical protein QTG54_004506 [Skeletonema marinoi]
MDCSRSHFNTRRSNPSILRSCVRCGWTKCEQSKHQGRVTIPLDSANWIPREVRDRLKTNEAGRINNEGYFAITCQENRTQVQNRKEAIKKLQDILKSSWDRPKVRKLRKGLTKKAKENRRENKKKISQKKENRRRVDF